jgi:hypothetical protein
VILVYTGQPVENNTAYACYMNYTELRTPVAVDMMNRFLPISTAYRI